MKYAFGTRTQGHVALTLQRSGKIAKRVVQDDGVGSPPGFGAGPSSEFGLSLVRLLGEQLDDSFSTSTRDGTMSVLEFSP